jgi:hypothetical protein
VPIRFHPLPSRVAVFCFDGCSTQLLTSGGLPLYRSGLPLRQSQGTIPSADFSHAVKVDRSTLSQFQSHATSRGTWEISRGKTQNFPCISARFIKHTPADGELRCHVPARSGYTTPHIPAFGGIRRPACLDWASFRPHLTMTPLPFSLPSAPLIPGVKTFTSQALCHARHTR